MQRSNFVAFHLKGSDGSTRVENSQVVCIKQYTNKQDIVLHIKKLTSLQYDIRQSIFLQKQSIPSVSIQWVCFYIVAAMRVVIYIEYKCNSRVW